MTLQQAQLIADLTQDLAPLVRDIEASPATTQHHYGRYGAVISQFAKGNRSAAQVIALALMKAGGNKRGVVNGLALFI